MSDTTTDWTYADAIGELDLDYVRRAGEALRVRLFPDPTEDGRVPVPMPVGLSYEPGNGTAYALLFVPLASIQQASAEVNEPSGAWTVPSGSFDADGMPREGVVLVVKANGADSDWAYPMDLSFGHVAHASYVGEHINANVADASAICALFRAVCGVEILDEP